jgi:hypothetical protein
VRFVPLLDLEYEGSAKLSYRPVREVSATGRGTARVPRGNYPTPHWSVDRFLERVGLPCGPWLEPSAGEGAIVRAVNESVAVAPSSWVAIEIREEARAALESLGCAVAITNFLTAPVDAPNSPRFAVGITNPDYDIAEAVIRRMLPICDHVAVLLRLNFLESIERHPFFSTEMPDVYVLPNRPQFVRFLKRNKRTGKIEISGGDATAYGWFHWTPERGRVKGEISVLDLTPPEVIRAARRASPLIDEATGLVIPCGADGKPLVHPGTEQNVTGSQSEHA